tara:strand:+ start:16548 stop:17699 length:1152 start_codon:yes stop_codon:yes gene_type:complete
MNISIIVGGRFHAFNLAEHFYKEGYLKQLITSYPKYYVKNKFKIPKNKIESIFLKELVQRSFFGKIFNLNDFLSDYFDKKAKNLINFKDLDILVGWSGFSYQTFLKAKQHKCIKILERGSTHIEFQNQILKEEYSIQNIKPNNVSKYIINKEKKEYDLADFIMVPTDFAKQTFLEKGFQNEKIIKNPYGVNLQEFSSNDFYKKNNNFFRIIYTGTVSVRKGVLYLLEVFQSLNLKNSELLIIGDIEKEVSDRIKNYKSNPKIIFKDPVKQSELKKFYNISDIFVTCSVEEGLSMVQLQAMACGLPVICTENSGGKEIINNNIDGYILPIRNKDLLKDKILFLYKNRHICNEIGKNAQKKATKQFSWEMYGQKTISIYQDLLKK